MKILNLRTLHTGSIQVHILDHLSISTNFILVAMTWEPFVEMPVETGWHRYNSYQSNNINVFSARLWWTITE